MDRYGHTGQEPEGQAAELGFPLKEKWKMSSWSAFGVKSGRPWTILVFQGLRIGLAILGTCVQSLVSKLRSNAPQLENPCTAIKDHA